MCRTMILGSLTLAIGCFVTSVYAEQQVKLQSGAMLVGNVSMEGANLVVDVEGAKIEVPFKDVASVTPATTDDAKQADQLLLRGLESHILSKGEHEELSLLAEAFRLAPEDPHVAFWYAPSQVNAGHGKGASEVFEPRRGRIVAAYPGFADRLASQIEERLAVEELPSALVTRLDQIAAAAKYARPIESEMTTYAAYFQLVDQSDEPIEQSAFRVNCSGQDENLESFADGYYLYTFGRGRGYGRSPCRLEVIQPELVSDVVEFNGAAQGAENVGVLRVKRLNDADRRPVVVNVVDPEGKPLSSATVTPSVISRSGGRTDVPPVTTTADGTAKLNLFPNEYSCQVAMPDYSPGSQRILVPADEKQAVTFDVKLFRAISATIKVVWRSKSLIQPGMPQFQNDAVTSGEFEQQVGPNGTAGIVNGRFGPPWVRLVQNGDKVQLQFTEQMNFPQAGLSWVGRWKRDAEKASGGRPPGLGG